MAITRTARGSITSKVSGTTLTIASQTFPARSLIVVYLAYDDEVLNGVTAGGTPMELGDAVIGAGVRTRLAWLYTVAGFTGTIVATWAAALTAKAMAADSFVSSLNGLIPYPDANNTNTGAGTAASTPATSAITGGTEAIRVGVVGTEGPSGDTAGTWVEPGTAGLRVGTTGNPAQSNVTVSGAYRLAPAAGSTTGLSKTGITSRDWGAAIRSFYWDLPPTNITGTAEFTQAAATWDASAEEAIPASAEFTQAAAAWDASANNVNPVTSAATFEQAAAGWDAAAEHAIPAVSATATFEQVPAGWAAEVSTPIGVEATAAWQQAAAGWQASASEQISGTASVAQGAASWSAAVSEAIPSAASFAQAPATWGGSATSAAPVSASASFTQAAAGWSGAVVTIAPISATAAWAQAVAGWSAVADHTFTDPTQKVSALRVLAPAAPALGGLRKVSEGVAAPPAPPAVGGAPKVT